MTMNTSIGRLACLLCLILATGNVSGQDGVRSAYDAGDLIWSDEFEGTGAPDPDKWERQEYNRRNNDNGPDGWWSNEDSYLDGNGNLVIRVRRIDNKNDDGDSCDYSVGMVRTKGRFEQLYGRFEIRCQLPTQPGWWVAFWMMQGDVSSEANEGVDGTEVDIMEGFGWTDKVQNAFHWDGYGSAHESISKQYTIPGIRDGFHTYSMEWYPEMYIFFIDGEEVWRSQGGGVCNQPGYIKVTGEISTEDWAISQWWANDPAGATYPDSFIIDYVRVFEAGDYQPGVSVGKNSAGTLRVFPNPASRQVRISWDGSAFRSPPKVRIMNAYGQVVRTIREADSGQLFELADLPPGVYVLGVGSENHWERVQILKL